MGASRSADTVRGKGTAPNVSACAASAPSGVAIAATASPRAMERPNAGHAPKPVAASIPSMPHAVGSGDGYDQASANDQRASGSSGSANQRIRRQDRSMRPALPAPREAVRALPVGRVISTPPFDEAPRT